MSSENAFPVQAAEIRVPKTRLREARICHPLDRSDATKASGTPRGAKRVVGVSERRSRRRSIIETPDQTLQEDENFWHTRRTVKVHWLHCRFLTSAAAVISAFCPPYGAAQSAEAVRLMAQTAPSLTYSGIVFSQDGRLAAFRPSDSSPIALWDTAIQRVLRTLDSPATLSSKVALTFSFDAKKFIVLDAIGQTFLQVYEAANGKKVGEVSLEEIGVDSVVAVSSSPVDDLIALSHPDGCSLFIVDLRGDHPKTIGQLRESPSGVCSNHDHPLNQSDFSYRRLPTFSPDGKQIAYVTRDALVFLSVPALHELRNVPLTRLHAEVLSYLDAGRLIAVGGDKGVDVFNTDNGERIASLSTEGPVTVLASSKTSTALIVGSNIHIDDHYTTIWSIWKPGSSKSTLDVRESHNFAEGAAFIEDKVESSTGASAWVSATDQSAAVRDLQTGTVLATLEGRSKAVIEAGFLPDSNGIYLAGWKKGKANKVVWERGRETVSTIELTGPTSAELEGCPDFSYLLKTKPFSDISKRLAKEVQQNQRWDYIAQVDCSNDKTVGSIYLHDGTLKAFRIADGRTLLDVHIAPVDLDTVELSPRGGYLWLTESRRLWNLHTGTSVSLQTQFCQTNGKCDAQFSGDDSQLGILFLPLIGSGVSNAIYLFDPRQPGENPKRLQLADDLDLPNVMALSPTGEMIALGNWYGTVYLLSSTSGRVVDSWHAHDENIKFIKYSLDGHWLLSIGHDGIVRVWNSDSHQLIASLAMFSDDSWAVTDPEGRYDASNPDESIGLHWVAGMRVIELQQLKRRYYTPWLLPRLMNGERLPTVESLQNVPSPPMLSMTTAYAPDTGKVDLNLLNDGGGVGQLLVKVNGRLLRTVDHPPSPPVGKSETIPIDLTDGPFVSGGNLIAISAYDAENLIESRPTILHYKMAASAKGFTLEAGPTTTLNAGRFFAVIAGTSTFGDPRMNLAFPAKDAESIATGLRLGAERLYGKERVWMRVLTTGFKAGEPNTGDGLPTKQNIRAAFDEVRRKARPEDTLVVYLSGHGVMSSTNRDLYYYLTADARTLDIEGDPALKDISTVSSAELFDWLREPLKTMPLKQVVILDTCAAGGASNDLMKLAERRDIPPDQRRAIELLKDATGTFILMGSAADAVSYEASKYGEGLLTYALLEGMRGVSLDDGSRLNVSRWFEDASEKVHDLAKSIGGIQKPLIAAPKGTGFPVALLTVEDRAKIPMALPRPQLLRVVCEDGNQGDPLHLRALLREQMRALNYAQARDTEIQRNHRWNT